MRHKFRYSAFTFLYLMLSATLLPAQQVAVEIHEGVEAVAREVIVKFRAVSGAARERILRENGIDFTEGVGDALLLRSARRGVAALLRDFAARPEVEWVEPNYVVRADTLAAEPVPALPNDEYFPLLYGLNNTGQTIEGQAGVPDADIDAAEAWRYGVGSKAIVVASMDSGVDFSHPDLVDNAWRAPAEFTVTIGNRTVTCPAGSFGYDAVRNRCGGEDDNDHGTQTTGIMGASGNNGIGVTGVNWNLSIMRCKFLKADSVGTMADAAQCLEFIRRTREYFGGKGGGADVIASNNSWGGGLPSRALADEIRRHGDAGILFVASAGNNGRNTDVVPQFPASFAMENVISVAATDNRDQLADFSNFGTASVDLGAPGVNVLSTIRNGQYDYYNGTSQAAPHVTGALALVKSVCPALSYLDLKNTILSTVEPIASLQGKTATGGRLNLANAVRSCTVGTR